MLNLADVKKHLVVEHSADDALITAYIAAAKLYIEGVTGRVLTQRQFTKMVDGFADTALAADLVSVDSVTYVDTNGDTQALASTVYQVVTGRVVGAMLLAYGQSWPSTRDQAESVTITYTAGYSTIPADLEQAVLLYIGHLYNNRESASPVMMHDMPGAISALCAPYRVFRL